MTARGSVQAGTVREIQARANAATEGPWTISDRGMAIEVGTPKFHIASIDTSYDSHFDRDACEADAEFIAHAREDIPWLLGRVRELEDAAGRLATALREAPATAYSEPYHVWLKSWCEPALEEYEAALAVSPERTSGPTDG